MKPKSKEQLKKEHKELIFAHKGPWEYRRKIAFHPAVVHQLLSFDDRNPQYKFEDYGKMLEQHWIHSAIMIHNHERYLVIEIKGFVYYIPIWQILKRNDEQSGKRIQVFRHYDGLRNPLMKTFKEYKKTLYNC